MKTQVIETESGKPPITLQKFCLEVGITAITAWRFRKRGWLETVNIAGRQYVTPEGIAAFNRRAAAGEFSREHKTPRRQATEATA